MEPGKDQVFIKVSLCSGGNKAGDGSGASRKSEEDKSPSWGLRVQDGGLGGCFGIYFWSCRAQVRAREAKRQQGRDLEGLGLAQEQLGMSPAWPDLSQVVANLGPSWRFRRPFLRSIFALVGRTWGCGSCCPGCCRGACQHTRFDAASSSTAHCTMCSSTNGCAVDVKAPRGWRLSRTAVASNPSPNPNPNPNPRRREDGGSRGRR